MKTVLSIIVAIVVAITIMVGGDKEMFGPTMATYASLVGYTFPVYEFPDMVMNFATTEGVNFHIFVGLVSLTAAITTWIILAVLAWVFMPLVILAIVGLVILAAFNHDVLTNMIGIDFGAFMPAGVADWNWIGIIAGIIGLIAFRWIWTREVDETI